MKPLSIDEIRRLLPELDEARPLMDRLLTASEPDEARRWSGSGELGTVGDRLVEPAAFEAMIPSVLEEVQDHLSKLYGAIATAVRAVSADDPEGAIAALLRAAEIEQQRGRLVDAEAFVTAGLRLASGIRGGEKGLPILIAGARLARALGRWELAETRYERATALARDAGESGWAATAAIGAGNVAIDRGIWHRARSRYDRAEAFVEDLPPDAPERWHLALNRSIVAREEGELDAAEGFLAQADEGVGEAPDGAIRALLGNARGQLLRARDRHEEAEIAFRRALDDAASPDARVTIAVNMAETLVFLGRTLEAGEVARGAEELAIAGRVVPRLPEVYRTLGRVAAARGHADAFVFFERALEVVRDRQLPEIERARVLEVYGDYDRARGEIETGRARLEGAASIYETLGCRIALDQVRARLRKGGPAGSRGDETNEEE